MQYNSFHNWDYRFSQTITGFDLHHRNTYWIFHIRDVLRETRGPYAVDGTYMNTAWAKGKMEKKMVGMKSSIIKKKVWNLNLSSWEERWTPQTKGETIFWGQKSEFWSIKGNAWRTLQRWAVWRSFLMKQRLQNSVQANKRAGEGD